MLSELFTTFFVVLLIVGVPILSYRTARDPRIRQAPRLALYFSAVLSQWILAVLGILVVLVGPMTIRMARFQPVGLASFLRWFLLVALISLAAMSLSILLERFGWWPEESDLVRLLIPETGPEKVWAVLVLAPTAALSEEFLYRGFLLAQLSVWFHSVAWAWAVSSVAFGLAHSYQGAVGVLRAAALGALLAYPVVHLGSLYPSMAAHFVIDAVALGWLGPAFLEKETKT
jgi:membrane protease YdiL (CAAX protease family)